ncbi:cardiolipin synthase [Paenibacillus phyllosphaerae]|uniref:Cardiolipin synthase n=1 Tax=Paenibacillus phyllosphaerae TaxID=274593 RepID=A0A7W5AVH2_9BACL|nr:cardiolipin synthase [Paenibacillus phyllosphaerae]MBB3109533.1 cardiolipin synthase [Paenibacillus phyllosphaerae]
MAWYEHLSTFVLIINFLLAAAVIFLERRNVGVTWAWLMVLVLIPVVGFILYLIFGQNLSKVKLYKLSRETTMVIKAIVEGQRRAYLQHDIHFHDEAMIPYSDLIYMNLSSGFALYTQDNDVEIYTDGNDKFDALIASIQEAKQHVHLMYYIVRDDVIGRRLMAALVEKAKEGVEVRFLYDHIGSTRLRSSYFSELLLAGGMVASFFPSKIPFLNFRVNYRNHRKLAIIDGNVGFIGGFNIGDEYLGLSERFGYWRDTHLRLKGSSVLQMQAHFLMDWNLASNVEVSENPMYFPVVPTAGTVGVQIVSSGPSNTAEQIKNAYIKMIHAAKEFIYIQTPYFIPDESVLTALRLAALSGVNVVLMIPAVPDHKMVYWASYSYLGDLLAAGGRCMLYERGFLHAKTIVVDGKIASVGTANVDIRSFKLNFEVNAIIYDSTTTERLKQIFETDMFTSRELTMEIYEQRSRLQRFKESFTRLLSPIL